MNPGQARYMSVYQYADSSKAARELDYHVPKLEDCIDDAVSWYRANGFNL